MNGTTPVDLHRFPDATYQTSPEATLYSSYARTMVHEMQTQAGPMLRADVASLAKSLGMSV